MKNNNKPFFLFANCKVVKGAKRSIICDLEENSYFFIPNSLSEIIKNYSGMTIAQVKDDFIGNEKIIDEYFEFLSESNLIQFTSKKDLFPELDTTWSTAGTLNNAILDIAEVDYNYEGILQSSNERLFVVR